MTTRAHCVLSRLAMQSISKVRKLYQSSPHKSGVISHNIDLPPSHHKDGRVVLRRHRPMTFPYPNAYSHPLPRFAYDSSTGNIHVKFSCDPSYPLPSPSPSTVWQERQYLISSVPKRKPPSVLDNAAQFFSSAISIVAPTGNVEGPVRRDEEGEFDLKEYEIVEEERSAENEADDSSDIHRDICVLSLPLMSEQGETHGGGSSKARERRRWEILPISKEKATFRSTIAKSPTRPSSAPLNPK